MPDRLRPTSFVVLARWILGGLERGEVLELPRELWFEPRGDEPYRVARGWTGTPLATPFGVAAGPHTQLAAGIVASWLAGARVLELKTVQRRAVEVVRPCIRIRDEGLNVEWSQELDPRASFAQYLDAWVLIHGLHRLLGWPGGGPETLFDISVGYDMEGLLSPEMQGYLALVADAGELLEERLDALARLEPSLAGLAVPSRLAASATISTLHGCPPEEIGAMARHLMEEHGLAVRVKLNPTLLGADTIRELLHGSLGWRELVPDEAAFAHDLGLGQAVELVGGMGAVAARCGTRFGVKLSNTLPLVHDGSVFPESERTMYLSGRPLHALTVQTALKLVEAVGAPLDVSFCGGADAFNVAELVAAGLDPVTVCSDLLRPGGVARLGQYAMELQRAMETAGAADPGSFALARARERGFRGDDPTLAARHNLERYAAGVLGDPRYRRGAGPPPPGLKGHRPLGILDCIHAPCVEDCGIGQEVPEYMRRVAAGDREGAAAVIRRDNALPVSLGRACHHPCETRCTREAYEAPLAIREIKRFAMEAAPEPPGPAPLLPVNPVAVVGAGPCGLAAALDLRRSGVPVTVLEARPEAAGMLTDTIPAYRAPDPAVARDLAALAAEGVEIRRGVRFGRDTDLDGLRAEGFGPVVLAAGAQRGRRMGIPGEELEGVLDGLELLRRARRGLELPPASRAVVVGGGDVAVDCARTLRRLLEAGRVEILYRRRVQDMPAQAEEIRALEEEGIPIRELLVPVAATGRDGRLERVRCERLRPGAPGPDGRPRPEPTGETVELPVDLMVVAIGQEPDPAVLAIPGLERTPSGWVAADPETGRTGVPGLWAGGDVVRGPSSLVAAAGDGRRIAADILRELGLAQPGAATPPDGRGRYRELLARRARRLPRVELPELPPERRRGFAEVALPLDEEAAWREAARCLECDLLCSTCVTVCPNRAFLTLELDPFAVRWGLPGKEPVKLAVTQPFQTVVLNDLCNACGNCTEFCPTAGQPHEDKPRLLLEREVFAAFPHNAVLLEEGALRLKWRGGEHRLEWGDPARHTGPGLTATLDPATGELLETRATGTPVDWEPCLLLLALARGLARRPELWSG